MSDSPYLINVVAGNASADAETIHKFGRNSAVGTSFIPVSFDGVYRTPQVSAATTVRVKAGNINDTAAGSGAREITIEGLDSSGAFCKDVLATAGTSASSSTSNSFLRIFRAYVSKSGTYASTAAGSHSANIVIENNAGTEDWITIDSADFPKGQSEAALYTVPAGKAAYITGINYAVDSGKTTSLILFKRDNILETIAPYSTMRQVLVMSGLQEAKSIEFRQPLGPFQEYTDFGFMAKVSATTSEVFADMEILLRDKE